MNTDGFGPFQINVNFVLAVTVALDNIETSTTCVYLLTAAPIF